ncbi:MAG: 5-formyltetrahydrofolate cyclo-ligase [bacterium]|nr:5-formyltetrahydrofolate cyclo-ligase [bacterium]
MKRNKDRIRKKMRKVTAGMESRQHGSTRIRKKLIGLERFKRSVHVFTYVSLEQEVDTRRIIDLCLKHGKKVYVPRIDPVSRAISVYRITGMDCLERGSYNILEPAPTRVFKSRRQSFDIILVPGLAFDAEQNRLGRGKGYFDRFLKKVKGFKIGLCFKEQLFCRIPADKNDVHMDLVLSDQNDTGKMRMVEK